MHRIYSSKIIIVRSRCKIFNMYLQDLDFFKIVFVSSTHKTTNAIKVNSFFDTCNLIKVNLRYYHSNFTNGYCFSSIDLSQSQHDKMKCMLFLVHLAQQNYNSRKRSETGMSFSETFYDLSLYPAASLRVSFAWAVTLGSYLIPSCQE